jgi:hypothetical protein
MHLGNYLGGAALGGRSDRQDDHVVDLRDTVPVLPPQAQRRDRPQSAMAAGLGRPSASCSCRARWPYAELTWLLNCMATVGELPDDGFRTRRRPESVTASLFDYPG